MDKLRSNKTGVPAAVPGKEARTALAVVVPTLQEAANVGPVLDRIRASLDPLSLSYELIVVDDDSGDGTESIVQGTKCHNRAHARATSVAIVLAYATAGPEPRAKPSPLLRVSAAWPTR